MTSGKVTSIPIAQITVENRQRKDLGDIESLAQSLRDDGQLHPIVISPEFILVAGERRLEAAKSLGWDTILAHFTTDLSESELLKLEIEENARRQNFNWKELCFSIEAYHRVKTAEDKTWTQEKTGEVLGYTQVHIADNLAVARALHRGVELVINSDKFSVARGIVKRNAERAQANQINEVEELVTFGKAPAAEPTIDPGIEIELDDEPVPHDDVEPVRTDSRLVCGDFLEWLQRGKCERKFNFIHCDFPYGINADKHDGTASDKFTSYSDSADVYFELLENFCRSLDFFCAESAHVMFWFSLEKYYNETFDALTSCGLTVARRPLIWYKIDNSGILPDPKRGPRWNYETAFLCRRGDRPIVQAVSDCSGVPNKKTGVHMSEKPQPMLRHFFRMFVDEHSHVFDPTAGSANSLKVAESMQAASVFGLERDPEIHALALETWKEEDEQ